MKIAIKILAYILVTLLILLAVLPLLVPISPAPGTMPVEELAGPGSQFVEVDGVKLFYKQSGVNKPVFILLHGFGASTFSWREVFDDLAEMGTVIAYDRPAFGFSERPIPGEIEWGDENPYGQAAQLTHLWGLMDTLGVPKAILVGHSAGGALALAAALDRPERVEALVLVDAAIFNSPGTPSFLHGFLQWPQVDRLGPLFARYFSRWGERLLVRAWHDPALITPDIVDGYNRPFQAENWDVALWELVKVNRTASLAGRLSELSVPVLVISGDDDQVIPTEDSTRLAEEIEGAKLVVIEECGHIPQEEHPAEFIAAVGAFLVE